MMRFDRSERCRIPDDGRTTRPTTAASGGSVLILALWALFFLAALAVAVGARVSASLDLARRIQDEAITYYLARAGIDKAIVQVGADTNAWDGLDESWFNDEKSYKDAAIGGGSFTVSYEVEVQPGRREVRYGVTGEESKININRAGVGLLRIFLETAGGVDSIQATELAAAICDWRDPDDDPLTGGAENSYYENLSSPYRCHNGDFESLHELRLVKGMGPDLLARLEPYLTVYGTGKVNINTADAVVLKSAAYECGGQAPVTCELLVSRLLEFRAAGGVFREPDPNVMVRQLGGETALRSDEGSVFMAMMRTITLKSTCFSGKAAGKVKGRATEGRSIAFVFDRERMTPLYWHEL